MDDSSFAPFKDGQELWFAEQISVKHYNLLLKMLEDYSDILGNKCCNDWDYPSDWDEKDKKAFYKLTQYYNKDEEATPSQDWIAVGTVANMVKSARDRTEFISDMMKEGFVIDE